jgi:HEPN domain-containing protein
LEKFDHIEYWRDASALDIASMQNIFEAGNYAWALFIGHLAIEKVLKAKWVQTNIDNLPPRIHNLKKLAECGNCQLSESQSLLLLEINEFNLEARYPDFKFDFHKKCTRQFAAEYIAKIKELYKCILAQM